MSVHEISCNPFQAPVIEPEIVRKKPADIDVPCGEYRIYDNKLLISGDTALPPVCVRTGETEDLISQETSVYFGTGSLIVGIFGGFFFMLCVFSLFIASKIFGSQFRPYTDEITVTIFLGFISALGITFDLAFRGLGFPTKITYYESREWRTHRDRMNRIIGSVLTAFLIVTAAAIWRFAGTPILFSSLMLMPLIIFTPKKFIGTQRYRGFVYALFGLPLSFLRDTPFPDQQDWVIKEADHADSDAAEWEDVWV